jgi:hypothetical protein
LDEPKFKINGNMISRIARKEIKPQSFLPCDFSPYRLNTVSMIIFGVFVIIENAKDKMKRKKNNF